jgi:hypothetical protein
VPVKLNPDFLQELEHDPKTIDGLTEISARFKDAVIAHVPVVTGETQKQYAARTQVEQNVGDSPVGLTIRYPLWHIIEYGSISDPPYRPFGRAAQSLGLKWSSR